MVGQQEAFIIRKTYRSATADNPSNNNKETRTLPTQKFWQYVMFNAKNSNVF